jgi:hypothetical protein
VVGDIARWLRDEEATDPGSRHIEGTQAPNTTRNGENCREPKTHVTAGLRATSQLPVTNASSSSTTAVAVGGVAAQLHPES